MKYWTGVCGTGKFSNVDVVGLGGSVMWMWWGWEIQ